MTAQSAEIAFRTYRRALLRFLMKRLSDSELAEDVAQDAFVRLLKATAPVEHAQAYLHRIARNAAYDRQARRDEVVVCDSALVDAVLDRYASTDAPDAEIEAERLLARLPALKASIVVLNKRDGLSFHEVTRELGISHHTVKRYLRLAVAQCRETRHEET